ncbi:G-patch domain protein, putative [Paecilomyces variotii No. 5]|uniref:G-patch domain protein, putative n=1 Tax=Byssochlamys spectabilis (strain No. 5 / NBRC 109023) TaxID=1356009 RepID=V5FVN1_BYSSN|nr:G-patch domain protein, putative [Paecilomyces variotii No. 5]
MAPQSAQDEEEDYMSMAIIEPEKKETFAQRKLRKQREAEAKAKVPSKAERAAQEAARREAALSETALDPNNKGFKMMAKLGFKVGDALGKQPSASTTDTGASSEGAAAAATDDWGRRRTEPLNITVKENRSGIGLDNEKKRKIREEAAEMSKKVKAEEGDYRERMRLEREERRTEAQVRAAQKVAEKLDAEADGDDEAAQPSGTDRKTPGKEEDEGEREERNDTDAEKPSADDGPSRKRTKVKPTSQINVLYRGLVRERQEKEREVQARHIMQTSLPSSFFPDPKLPGFEDPNLDSDDRHALGLRKDPSMVVEQELDEEDPELDEFNQLEPKERLMKLVLYLREKHQYCFWCKYRYETDTLEGCPGLTEEDHD